MNDLIGRAAAIEAVTNADRNCLGAHGAREAIRALPAASQPEAEPVAWHKPDAAERKRRNSIGDHHNEMLDAQGQCVPCRLCGGKAIITDAGPGLGYSIECENAARFSKPTCLQSGTRISGWAYNVSDLWNRLNTTPAPVVPAEGLVSEAMVDAAFGALPAGAHGTIGSGEMDRVFSAALRAHQPAAPVSGVTVQEDPPNDR